MSARDALIGYCLAPLPNEVAFEKAGQLADAFRAEVLNEAADALSVWLGDQTPEEERPGYDGPTIDAADRLDDALRPMPWEDRAQLISEHRQMVVGEVATELRRMAAAGQAPAPQSCCHLHKPSGCCDPEDCGPCCEDCPTCPRLESTAPQPETVEPDTDDNLARVCPWWRCHLAEPHPAHLGCLGIEQPAAPQPETAPGADGLREWHLTRDNLNEIDDQIDADGIYAKGYWETVDGKLVVTGLRIGTGEDRVVARFGDTIVRHPDGTYSVRPVEGGVS